MRQTLAALALVLSVLWPTAAQAAAPAGGRVALIGVPGLQWSDLSPESTPNLWRLAGQSAVGSLSVRAVGRVTCPYDGWLTVSAGTRSAVGYGCGLPPEPVPGTAGAVIPDYAYLHQVARQKNAGTLGEAVHAAGECTSAVGPGAALALADRTGKVDRYAPSPERIGPGALTACRVIAVDVDDLIRPYVTDGRLPAVEESLTPPQRAAALRLADAKAGAVLDALPQDVTVLLAGLADHGAVPHLRAAMMRAADTSGRFLGAASTHREDVTILPDITATMLAVTGIPTPVTVIGAPWQAGGSRTGGTEAARTALMNADVAGQTIRNVGGIFFTTVAALQVLFYLTAFLLLRRGRGLAEIRVAALALASVPVSTYLVNLLPWHHSGTPVLALIGGIAGAALLLAAVALAGPWRRNPLGPLALVAGVTAAVLAGDLLTGTTLQLNSVMGYTAVVGARYYGLGNIPFALFATSVLLLATAIAHRLAGRGRRTAAVAVVAVLGCSAMILGGWPGVGSDFGGVIAFVPGIAVTALLIAGRRVSVVKLGAFCVAGGVTVMAIAYLDYMRPPGSQTHLGRFVGQVFTGEAMEVIGRKLGAMLGTLLSPNLMPIVIAAAAFLVYALLRPGAASAGVLPAAFGHSPALRAGLIGTLVSGVVGMLVNDSGAAVLSMALALGVPLTLSVGVRVLRDGAGRYGDAGQESASSSLVSRSS
ncbi:hypothetical protein [Streptosporangium roseum]|uniref:Uncharacterized protein n=1 Tax=Streptosporangium roseum (strain ATCC 12428 / DSM 43021 / JCM 3005 / KCTC 9067 / NCIMB 10171 / NRRL 2505 / NI 9100) TaxID=479432 RepID=D2AWT2_STRRD|nr:hypothetical protein [Streptosporangium roseum]ACZ88860.1 hypothetical protein Sros_6129 [Streptosporangium roseum DSM 43021]